MRRLTRRATMGRGLAAAAALLVSGQVFADPAPAVATKVEEPAYDGGQNVFYSPCGQPFRGLMSDPYVSAIWFGKADLNGDGRLDRIEFRADFERFFKVLDVNHDGIVSAAEVTYYERVIAPEIIGVLYKVNTSRIEPRWHGQESAGLHTVALQIDPGGGQPDSSSPKQRLDESHTGASFYSFFDIPEPVASADFNFNGLITKPNFLKLADIRFDALDVEQRGYLVLNDLPKTGAQKVVERAPHKAKRKVKA